MQYALYFIRRSVDVLGQHVPATVLAFFAALLSGIPQYLARIALGDSYQGIPFLFQDAEGVYLTRIRELQDGYLNVVSPFLHEYKTGGVSLMAPFGEYVYFFMSGFGAISLESVVVWSKYLFPFVLFLLVYAFVLALLDKTVVYRRTIALGAASVVVLGYEIVHVRTAWAILTGTYDDLYLSIWTRLVNPIIGALCLFGFLISVRFVMKHRWFAAIPATLLLALSSGYIFSFGIGIVAAVLLAFLSFMYTERKVAYALLGVTAGAIALMLPYLFTAVMAAFASLDASGSLKTGLLLTHMPIVSTVLMIALIVVGVSLFFEWYREGKISLLSPSLFCFVALLSGFIAMNQQVITGRTIWPQHFVQYTIPLSIISVFVVYGTWASRFVPKAAAGVPAAALLVSFLLAIQALPTYAHKLPQYQTVNRYAPALAWLKSAERPCVVLPIEEYEHLNTNITAFTSCDVYLTHYVFSGVPHERILHNFLVYLRFQGVMPDTVETYLDSNETKMWGVFFRDWRDLFFHQHDPYLKSISDREEIREWVEVTKKDIVVAYRDFYARPLEAELKKYALDYIVWDREDGTEFDASQYAFLEPMFEQGGIVVYRVR